VIDKIKVGRTVIEKPKFIGFAGFGDDGDGFLMVFAQDNGRKYAISLDGKIYNILERGAQLFIEIPYGKQTYRVPLRFKL
jgi:hypothetical protein